MDRPVDAFILFNERETAVVAAVGALEQRGVATYFAPRDIKPGQNWAEIEERKLNEARTAVVFLGAAGWGPSHLPLAERADKFGKRILPVLIGNPPEDAFEAADGLFRRLLYADLRELTPSALDRLAQSILGEPGGVQGRPRIVSTPEFDRIISTIRDGNETERADMLDQIRSSKTVDRQSLSERLRSEIEERFRPDTQSNFASSIRDLNKIPSIRSWLLSCLIWTDAEDASNRDVILRHVARETEPDRNVRFWTLAQLYVQSVSYLQDAAARISESDSPETLTLVHAIRSPQDPKLISSLRSSLFADEFEKVWSALRVLRIVPIPELAPDVCKQLERSIAGTPLAYDALYALSNPEMANAAVPLLMEKPGVEGMLRRVLDEARTSDPNAVRNFVGVLAALPEADVARALDVALNDPRSRSDAELVRGFLRERKRAGTAEELIVAGYASDTIDIDHDYVGIGEDVGTLAAVMMASEFTPPLAIGLFGDWGSGKSFFMQSLRKATESIEKRARESKNSRFCSRIVSIEFNAWHYADTNLWASIVSHILERLTAEVSPEDTPEQKQAALVGQLGSAKAIVKEAEGEKQRTEELIAVRTADLQEAQTAREQKEIRLRDLQASDFRALIEGDPELKQKLDGALDQMAIPKVLDSVADLAEVVKEAYTLRGRIVALLVSVLQGKNRRVLITLLIFVLLIIPGAAYLLSLDPTRAFSARVGAIVAEVVTFVGGATTVLRKALRQVNMSLTQIGEAKRRVDAQLAKRRQQPSEDEKRLQKEIARLKAKENESQARISEATARVADLEERIKSAQQGRSLAQFLAERTRSEDYRKYLGLISTVRQDFDSLSKRLAAKHGEDNLGHVDRIILYIDDLDRCPEDKVIEVLQAVHLLLAYPLFVVVVAVDPRWLLHSLQGAFRAFRANQRGAAKGHAWQTTPQNYLEKIFQIPFALKPMTDVGFSRMMNALMLPKREAVIVSPSPQPGNEPEPNAIEHAPGPDVPPAQLLSPAPLPPGPPPPKPVKPEFIVHEEALVIKPWEVAFADRLFALIPTPRAAKRFSNVYRILKAPVQRDHLRAFEGTKELPGEFQVPMLLLAILTGAPADAVEMFPKLWKAAVANKDPFEELIKDGVGFGPFQERLRTIILNLNFPRTPNLYIEWIPRVSRFSFDVGRAVESSRYIRPATQQASA